MIVKNEHRIENGIYQAACIVAALVFSIAEYLMLEYSCDLNRTVEEIFSQKETVLVLLNILVLFVMNLILRALSGKWGRALLIGSIVITVWSIANHYTLLYHGGPLFPSELLSAGTAFEVMGDYSYEIDHCAKGLIVMGAVLVTVSAALTLWERKKKYNTPGKTIGIVICATAGMAILYFYLLSPSKIIPQVLVGWKWSEGVENFGFLITAIDDTDKMIHSVIEPEGYSASKVREYEASGIAASAERYPDIILILNESYYKLDDLVETGADADYMQAFYGIDHAVYGHSAVSHVGGGTNNSEFELLTGNSMALLNSYAPFNYYNFDSYKDDFVHYLKGLGYTTAAMHPSKGTNYRRNIVYPKLGFDDIVLGNDQFKYKKLKNGKRKTMDANNYKDLIDHYDALGDGPRFVYLVTMQNHAGYDKNDPDLDTVHVSKDFGELTDDVNEYLTSIRYSSEAFKEITEHYREVDRPVIICMAGDHAPAFVTQINTDNLSGDERIYRSLMVPYVIWSNYDLDTDGIFTDTTTHYELMPMIFKMAGLPMTPYQKTILDLHDEVPVLTKFGYCIDRDGNMIKKEDSPFADLVNKYYYLEYNALKHDSGYREEMFKLPE